MRVIFDTNVLVSFAMARGAIMDTLYAAWLAGAFELQVSDVLLKEFSEVIERPHLRRFFVAESLGLITDLIEGGQCLVITPPYPVAPDRKDSFLLAMLSHEEAEVLVTGDKGLLSLGHFEGKPIVNPAAFVREYLASP